MTNFFYLIINKITGFFVSFLYTQIIVTLVGIPILVSWGLGISAMTFIGNLIFTPFLCFFLLNSSLIFFTEIFGISNGLLITSLEHSSSLWQFFLNLGNKKWIIYFAKPPIGFLFLIPVITLIILISPQIRSKKTKLVASVFFLAIIVALLWAWTCYISIKEQKICFDKKLAITNTDIGIRLIDNGFLNRKKSVEKFVEFELKPFIIERFGTPVIDEFIILKPGSGSCATGAALCSSGLVKNIVMPHFKAFNSKLAWAKFFDLQNQALINKISIERTSFINALERTQELFQKKIHKK